MSIFDTCTLHKLKKQDLHKEEIGFTLLELLVTLTILVSIASLVMPRVTYYLDKAKIQTANIQLDNIKSAMELYRLDTGQYPSKQEGLRNLMVAPFSVWNWNGPYLNSEDDLKDPWGFNYQYRVPGQKLPFNIFSYGADGKEGGDDLTADIIK